MGQLNLQPFHQRLQAANPLPVYGKVVDVVGLTIEATGPPMRVGDLCYLQPRDTGASGRPVAPTREARRTAEVVGFRGDRVLLMPLGEIAGIGPGSVVIPTFQPQRASVGIELLGRTIDSNGNPLDGAPIPPGEAMVPLTASPPQALERQRILEPLATGIRAIDACITIGKGQRVGILSGSGVGKSKLLGMIARNTSADVNVIALIGERGREVRDFIEVDLGPKGLARSVVVVATSDQPAMARIKGAYRATAIAEWFRGRGADVMLIMDSITRFAMAQREVGLAIGEPPTTKGYPPSVYSLLPKLCERAGTSPCGSITGIYAVLVEADDFNDPVGDATRSILDGHVALSRNLASRNHYPAIDILNSISRCMIDVSSKGHQDLAGDLRRTLAVYQDAEDLVNIGAYVEGSNPDIDRALKLMPRIRAFLQQDLFESSPFDEVEKLLRKVLK